MKANMYENEEELHRTPNDENKLKTCLKIAIRSSSQQTDDDVYLIFFKLL